MRIKVNDKDFERLAADLEDIPNELLLKGTKYFRDATPVRSGNARRNTFRKGDTIKADYAYAQRLDDGYSRQAPNGMTDPTIDYIQRELDERLRRSFRNK